LETSDQLIQIHKLNAQHQAALDKLNQEHQSIMASLEIKHAENVTLF
jgi:hypothetical protein